MKNIRKIDEALCLQEIIGMSFEEDLERIIKSIADNFIKRLQ
jgi:hypothetical protein